MLPSNAGQAYYRERDKARKPAAARPAKVHHWFGPVTLAIVAIGVIALLVWGPR